MEEKEEKDEVQSESTQIENTEAAEVEIAASPLWLMLKVLAVFYIIKGGYAIVSNDDTLVGDYAPRYYDKDVKSEI